MSKTKLSESSIKFSASINLVGDGASISSLNYNYISNPPNISQYIRKRSKGYTDTIDYSVYANNNGGASYNNVTYAPSATRCDSDFSCSEGFRASGLISAKFKVVEGAAEVVGTDENAGSGYLRIISRSFTGIHRCYTNDILFNEEDTEENIQNFKNNYIGRVVISIGKIATLTGKENTGFTINYDKNGITIEDALPIVQLSRIKKDIRVFGVFGSSGKNTTIKRMFINSIGEGAIWVVNTNSNIENGDYLQSSDELGYAEKQDDDILHNYTVGKSTIDCNFELNSDKYETIILENGVLASFIACTYHCG